MKKYDFRELDTEKVSIFNPLQAAISSDEVSNLRKKYKFVVNENIMTNPLTLFKGLRSSATEVVLIETTDFKIVGNEKCEISLRTKINEVCDTEKGTLLKLVDQLRLILEIQKELH